MPDAREIIARVTEDIVFYSDGVSYGEFAAAFEESLTAAGYRILGPDEVDPVTVGIIEQDLLALLEGEFSSLTIGFNDDHAANYVTAQQWHDEFGEYKDGNDGRISWVSEEERQRAIVANSVWSIQWYPRTPVGSHCVGASSLGAITAAIRAIGRKV